MNDAARHSMKASFTGTRQGMTSLQYETLIQCLRDLRPSHLVHGDCIGADAQAHQAALNLGITPLKRPCTIESMRAWTRGGGIIADAEAPLARNRKIAADGEILIAAPKGRHEVRRSGTWATVRYALALGRQVLIICPNGEVDARQGYPKEEK